MICHSRRFSIKNSAHPSRAKDLDLQWFAAEDEGRTEEPSEYKLQKAREEGRVPKSNDLNSSLVFLFTVIVLIFLARSILTGCADLMRFYFERCNEKAVLNSAYFAAFALSFLKMVIPISITGIAGAFLGNIIQNRGFIFTLKTIEPKFSKIVPKFGEYFKNTLFSLKGVFNIVKSLGKVAIIVLIAYILIKKNIPLIVQTIKTANILASVKLISKIAAQLMVTVAVLFIVVSIPDYFVNRREFMESMKMTKYEQKQEFKEMEGDPEIKNRLKEEQKRILSQNMPKAVREADVVITNPTHFAVSMKYEASEAIAPEVTFKGEDEIALQMRRIAAENNVPVIENRPLARSLYTDTEIGDIIPERYWSVLAEVYAEVGRFNQKRT